MKTYPKFKTKYHLHIVIAVFGFCYCNILFSAPNTTGSTSYHKDRGTPRLQIMSSDDLNKQPSVGFPDDYEEGQETERRLSIAQNFLRKNAKTYKIPPDISNLEYTSSDESLDSINFHFRQKSGNYPIEKAEIIVSVNSDYKVDQVYNNTIPLPGGREKNTVSPKITKDKAYNIAWTVLGAGKKPEIGLLGEPKAELIYVLLNKKRPVLSYVVRMYISREAKDKTFHPGLWEVTVNANNGSIVRGPVERTVRENKKPENLSYNSGHPGDFHKSLQLMQLRNNNQVSKVAAGAMKTNGTLTLFDPDPATSLNNASLVNNSPTTAFEKAYVELPVSGITFRSGLAYLEGDWVKIVDFEPPSTPPSSSKDKSWRAKRGDNSFNDAMVFYYIDLSQRYIQSLGFKNIQAIPIEADSDGFFGQDQSHFIPFENKLAFGHGCVPDPEDPSVIMHEYGHAITYGINQEWDGGDSGAIGEGFGDYWAATFKYVSRNGEKYHPYNVFNWDATSGCWSGRTVNKKSVKYNPKIQYAAHKDIGGGMQSDELWSTPLFEAFLELRRSGASREEIDKIVLGSMYGIGYGFTMQDLANKTVDSAKKLYPKGKHADVFLEKFKKFGIL